MIETLLLKNVILIDSCTIDFKPGLNIITGETGSGKSAIMHALSAILGARADTNLIRKGADVAIIEATFDASIPHLDTIEIDPSEPLIIRREITRTKSRLWIQGQLAPLHTLQSIAPYLAELITQGAYHTLKSPAHQLSLLDTFGHHDLHPYTRAKKQLHDLQNPPDIAALEHELAQIQSLNLKDNEEELLFEEHSQMANAQEFSEKSEQLAQGLEQATTLLASLSRLSDTPALSELLASALTNCQEADLELSRLQTIEFCPKRFTEIEERLSTINTLKRALGCDFQALQKHTQDLKTQIENAKNHAAELALAEKTYQDESDKLFAVRTKTAKKLSEALTAQIRELGMPKSSVSISIDPMTIHLAANPGEKPILIQDISGGELSRILLAFKLLSSSCPLIFDEIDSNIGGQTATLIGHKLKTLAQKHQVICITHFPQVAKCADHHLQITKKEEGARTLTKVLALKDNEAEAELQRMLGVGHTL